MRNLIICPVGNPLTFDSRFNKDEHWRYTQSHRLYETLVFQYSDFVPEQGTYDRLEKKRGFKWNLSKDWLLANYYKDFEYIGFMDDDLITDIDNINRALTIAKQSDLKIFQMSVTQDSDEFFPILRHMMGMKYTTTNFVETMGMFIHTSLIPVVKLFWNQYDIYTGWGFDKVLCDITRTDAAVIHSSQMYHPKKESSYDKGNAFREMDHVIRHVTPKFMKDEYDIDWKFTDKQEIKQITFEI